MEKVLFKIRGLEVGGIERLVVDIANNLELKNKKIVLLTEKKIIFFKNNYQKILKLFI